MDDDRRFGGSLSDKGAYPYAAVVVLTLAAAIGLGLADAEKTPTATPVVALAHPPNWKVSYPPVRPSARPSPTSIPAAFQSLEGFVGLTGLPPDGADPSTPEVGTLVDSWWVDGGGLPYRGMARLYADGRLIWNRYYRGSSGPNSLTTGYLEQRVTPETVESLDLERSLARKDPLWLLERLPLDSWVQRTPIPYVPSGYGICLSAMDPSPGRANDSLTTDPSELVPLLPSSVSALLEDRDSVSPVEWEQDCVAMTTDEARVLENLLHSEAHDQVAFFKPFLVQFSVDVPGAYGMQVSLMFEPRFPDGAIGCSGCG
jgi:hypothetical protein